jgi:GNAT superfamily N-acetyltransferase
MRIRRYAPEDFEAIADICLNTGLRGQLSEMFVDTDLFLDMWLAPYLHYEPDAALVAEDAGEVVGYLVGSFSPWFIFHSARVILKNMLRMASRKLLGAYRDHEPSRQFVNWFLYDAIHELPSHPPHASHLHFNVIEEYRNHWFRDGAAGRLLRRYEQLVYARGLRTYYGTVFTTPHRRRHRLYERGGYEIYDSQPISLFNGEDVELTVIVKSFDEEQGAWPRGYQ